MTIDDMSLEDPREPWEDWEPPAEDDTAFLAAQDADRTRAEDMAEWLAGVQRRRAEIGAPIQAKIDALEVRLAALRDRAVEIDAPLAKKAAYLEGWLAAYGVRERERTGGKSKSVKLLYATVDTADRPGGWDIDLDTALPWFMAEQPDLVVTKSTVNVAAAKKVQGWQVADGQVVTPDGEVVPGVTVRDRTMATRVTLTDTGDTP